MISFSSSLSVWWWALMLPWDLRISLAFGTFGFVVHHRYSDPVKGILAADDLPEKGTVPYYAAMARRDHFIHGRGLAADDNALLTFADGNETVRLRSLGFLHYANVSVGTPSSWFLVALDTGSDLFWLPCDCTSCVHSLSTSSGDTLQLNIYSPKASSTSAKVPCNSTMCGRKRHCWSAGSDCPYQVLYLSNGTSSTGILVEDVLRLTTEDTKLKTVDAQITFGCGKVQAGSFLDGAAPNGLFGLGMANISVPSTLASKGLASNSFSLCFGADGTGRISFGDKGNSDQGETPFTLRKLNPTYNISITQIIVGGNAQNLKLDAVFDSGTSFTYLNDPVYTLLSESFNSLVRENRHSSEPDIPFEYCYGLSSNQISFSIPTLNLTMEGGDHFDVTDPVVVIPFQGESIYCLGVVRSGDVNIIGQNFMTGYRIVFDREKMVLGWKASNCYDDNYEEEEKSKSIPVSVVNSPAIPPTVAVNPKSNAESDNNNHVSASGASQPLMSLTCAFLTILFPFHFIV